MKKKSVMPNEEMNQQAKKKKKILKILLSIKYFELIDKNVDKE